MKTTGNWQLPHLLLRLALARPALYNSDFRRGMSTTVVLQLQTTQSSDATTIMATSTNPTMVVATRLHLDKATVPPTDLDDKVLNFGRFCADSCAKYDVVGVLAVDAAERIPGYNLVEAVRAACEKASHHTGVPPLQVLPVQPWGQFVPALNALVHWAAPFADQILLASAETKATSTAIAALRSRMTSDTLVCGALLPGHDYQGGGGEMHEQEHPSDGISTELNGRTTPWNTLALWDLKKLALTGFQSVSEGSHNSCSETSMAGVEEVVAIAVLQKLLGPEHTKAKLVRIDGVEWDQHFDDPARQQWHERKMQSKTERAAQQLALTGLQGIVYHC
jgi:hypothetical protein